MNHISQVVDALATLSTKAKAAISLDLRICGVELGEDELPNITLTVRHMKSQHGNEVFSFIFFTSSTLAILSGILFISTHASGLRHTHR